MRNEIPDLESFVYPINVKGLDQYRTNEDCTRVINIGMRYWIGNSWRVRKPNELNLQKCGQWALKNAGGMRIFMTPEELRNARGEKVETELCPIRR